MTVLEWIKRKVAMAVLFCVGLWRPDRRQRPLPSEVPPTTTDLNRADVIGDFDLDESDDWDDEKKA